MIITISGVDKFTNDAYEYFTVEVDLMKDEFKISHEKNRVKIYVNDDYYVSSKDEFEISNFIKGDAIE